MLPDKTSAVVAFAAVLSLIQPPRLTGQQPEDQATRLAKATQNPVSDLVSLPFQFNFNMGGGFDDRTSFVLNFQPVVPIKGVFRKWNVIARTIVPYVSVPGPGGTRQGGLGDIQEQLFLTPVKSGSLIWGVGPEFSFPTATSDLTATGSWALGVAAVVVKNVGPFVLGGLIDNVWTYADEGGTPDVNQFILQPFVNYNFGKGWAAAFAPVITANWEAPTGEEWTVPFGVGISKTTAFNRRPMSVSASYYHNLEYPTASAANQFRVSVSLLYPSRPPGQPIPP
jgi:hypothetical protein